MDEDRGHPHLLLWYVSGDLEPAQARETEAHLARCRDCAAEAKALASMLQNLRQSRSGGLADMTAGARAGDAPLPEALHPASPPRDQADTRRDHRKRRWPILAGLAAAVILAVIAIPALIGSRSDDAPRGTVRQAQSVVLAPPLRGAGSAKVLSGDGPWAISVVLPFGAPEGIYELRIEAIDQPAHPVMNASLPADTEGRLSVVVDSLPRPGRFVMSVRPREDGTTSPYIYAFQTVAGPTDGA